MGGEVTGEVGGRDERWWGWHAGVPEEEDPTKKKEEESEGPYL